MDRLISTSTCVPTHVADDPISCVAIGIGKALAERRGISEDLIPAV
jgi:rod shape-determining protein MreB